MRILVITGSLYNSIGGPFLSVRSFVQALLEAGHVVVVVGSKDQREQSETPDSYLPLLEKYSTLTVKALNKYGPYNYHFTPALIGTLNKYAPYGMVFLQGIWMWNSWKTFFFAKRRNIFLINSIRGEFNDAKSIAEPKKKLFLPFVEFMLNRSNLIHVLNSAEADVLKNRGITSMIEVIHNGIYLPRNTKTHKAPPKKILYLGRLDPLKNIENLIMAWKIFDHKEWELIIAGTGEEKFVMYLEALCENAKNIKLIGPVYEEAKKSLLQEVGWFILPSMNEGMPMAVLEAASYGVPSVITKECNLPQLIAGGAAIETKQSIDEIRDSLIKAITLDDDDWSEMSTNSYKIIKDMFSWESVVKGFSENISKVNSNLKL